VEFELSPEMRQRVFDQIRAAVVKDRAGIHLSDNIYCLRKAYFRKMGLSPQPSDELCLLWLTGYAFQAYMFPLDKEITFQVDGIDCTPDIPSGIEVKSTRMSMGKFDPNNQLHWQRQILGYCKALNLLEYDLVVMHVAGNYRPPFPDIVCYRIKTTQEEIDFNWQVILENAKNLQEALTSQTPPVPTCQDWEWEHCENVELCPDTACYRKYRMKKTGK